MEGSLGALVSGLGFAAAGGPAEETLSDRAMRLIYDDIVAGRFEPGDRLKPEVLKERYSLGVSPIREGLLRLSAIGLVRLEGWRGFQVAPASEAELMDICDVRVQLSTSALRRSVANGDDDWEARVVAAFHKLERLKAALLTDPEATRDEWELRNRQFHHALESACGSPWLLYFAQVAYGQSERYRRHFVWYPDLLPKVQEEHRAMMDAAFARDADRAAALLEAHIRKNVEAVRAAMAKAGEPATPRRRSRQRVAGG